MANIVQIAKGTGTSGTSASATFSATTVSGNMLVAFLVTSTATLGALGSWTNPQSGFGSAINIYGLYQILAAGATTYTVNMGGTAGPWTLVIVEITGQQATPFDKSAVSADTTSTAAVTGTTTTTAQANELFIGVMAYNSTTTLTWSALTSGWGQMSTADTTGTNGIHQTVVTKWASATATANAAATISSSKEHLGVILTFKTAANAGPTLGGTMAGAGTAAAALTVSHPLAGESDGASTATATLSAPPPISSVQSNTVDNPATANPAVTLPTGVTLGNLLIAILSVNSAATVTPPAGWNLGVLSQPTGSPNIEAVMFWKVVDAGEAGNTSWTFGLGASHASMVYISEMHNSLGWPVTPLDALISNPAAAIQTTAMSTGTTPATLTAVEYAIAVVAWRGVSKTFSGVTAGWTNEVNSNASGGAFQMAIWDQITAATGTQNLALTLSASEFYAGAILTFGWMVELVGESDGVGTASGTLTVAHPLAGESDGASTAVATLGVSHALAGEADGVATATAALIVTRGIAGTMAGGGTATAALTIAHPLAAEADGVSTATATLGVSHALAGTSAGAAVASAALSLSHPLASEADGVAVATATLTIAHPLTGESDGVATALATLGVSHALAGEADGVGTASATLTAGGGFAGVANGIAGATVALTVSHPLAGESDGVATSVAALTVSHTLSAAANGVGSASATLIIAHPLAGSTNGVGSASATLGISHGLAGSANGVGAATAVCTIAHSLSGESDGNGSAVATVNVGGGLSGTTAGAAVASATLLVSHPLAGESDATGTATAALTTGFPLAGSANGVGTATANLTTSGFAGTAQGTSSASATLVVTRGFSGESDGRSTALATIGITRFLQGSAEGVSTAFATLTIAIAIIQGVASVDDAPVNSAGATALPVNFTVLSEYAVGTSTATDAERGNAAPADSALNTASTTP